MLVGLKIDRGVVVANEGYRRSVSLLFDELWFVRERIGLFFLWRNRATSALEPPPAAAVLPPSAALSLCAKNSFFAAKSPFKIISGMKRADIKSARC